MSSSDLIEHISHKKERSSKESLGFAVTLIGFCIFVIFTIIPLKFQDPINTATAAWWQTIKIFAYITITILISYVFLVGSTLNPRIKNEDKIKTLNKSSYLYETSFYIITSAPLLSSVLYINTRLFSGKLASYTALAILALVTTAIIVEKLIKIKADNYTLIVLGIFLIIGIIYVSNTNYDLTEINIEMENVYEKGNFQIPISIKVTGQNENLTVLLYEQKATNDSVLYQTEQLNFNIKKPRVVEEDKSLYGLYLDEGIYNIYVNTKNMDPGIYGLTFQVHRHNEYKTFLILDNNTANNSSLSFDTDIQNKSIQMI
ncbi:MAG: hypothetical protein ACFFCD_17260 [Promethearchaeota archaeon]